MCKRIKRILHVHVQRPKHIYRVCSSAWWTFSMRDKVEISGIPTLTRSLITTVHDTILIRFHNKKYLITKNIWSQIPVLLPRVRSTYKLKYLQILVRPGISRPCPCCRDPSCDVVTCWEIFILSPPPRHGQAGRRPPCRARNNVKE